MTAKSIEVYANEYKKRLKTKDFMFPAENLVRHIKSSGLDKVAKNNNQALDFGCGEGRHTIYLSQCGYKLYSVDVDESAIDATQTNALLNDVIGQLTLKLIANSSELHHLENKFNLILAWEVLHWLGNKISWIESLKVFHKILSSEGRLILTMPTENHFLLDTAKRLGKDEYRASEKSREGCLFYAPNLELLKQLFKTCGFKIIKHSFYAHGTTEQDWSISNPFSMNVFTLGKD